MPLPTTGHNSPHHAAPYPTAPQILVVGGGMAGVFAAIAAARAGRSVLLVEPSNVLGGQGTAGGVAGFCGDTENVHEPFNQLVARLAQHNLIAPANPTSDRRAYDLEWCAFYLQELAFESNVDILLHATVVDASHEAGVIKQVRLATPDGLLTVHPRFVIDATGRCIVPLKAGFPVEHLGENAQLPMSLYFTLWDTHLPVQPILPPNAPTWASDDQLPMTTLHAFPTGKFEVKMKVVGFDAADPFSLTQAELFARRQMMGLIYHLQTRGYQGKRYDTFTLSSVSRHIGVREERRIFGEHTLTESEISHACTFPDAVAVGTYHLDYHWPDTMQRAGTGITTMVEPYHIPLRAMIPKGAANLLVPGRGAAGDQMAMSSFRVMATVAQMGLAAGVAADEYLRQKVPSILHINTQPLQAALKAHGQSVNLSNYGRYLRNHLLRHEHVFEEDRPFKQCHASSIVQLPDNRFLVAYFAGAHESNPDVGIWLSERRHTRWAPPRLVAKVNQQAHWNPVLFQSPAGPLVLYFKVGTSPRTWRTYISLSHDLGESWSSAVELLPDQPCAHGPVRCKPLILHDGTVLAPGSDEGSDEHVVWRAFVDRSDDGGLSFTPGPLLPLDPERVIGHGVIQPTLWESQPGHVHMLLRSTAGWVYRADSNDAGRSWSDIYPTNIPNNNKGVDITHLGDKYLALICNPTNTYRAQTPLAILLSPDNGQSWTHRLDLETQPGMFIYPAIIPTQVGLAVSYTWQRERIVFWQGSIEHIPATTQALPLDAINPSAPLPA